jgi:Asp-tRNA(Asn)/Glu-tRNA(Gln) amidotransferase A subunit family amidase
MMGLGLAELVARGQVSAVELLELARSQARRVNPSINAIVRWMDAVADERTAAPLSGPFAGVPFLLKDLGQEYAGLPSAGGCRALADAPAADHGGLP